MPDTTRETRRLVDALTEEMLLEIVFDILERPSPKRPAPKRPAPKRPAAQGPGPQGPAPR